ncbi:MAG: hypothetical protein M4579_004409 [Chaenotheca gracillima]|nr:MAG: hypothetical protein M4579_004409 [Chaenotheca gracillima]
MQTGAELHAVDGAPVYHYQSASRRSYPAHRTPLSALSFMPIKLPKGFARRKSSGNALEELENVPDPSSTSSSSFRVLERPPAGSKSFDGGVKLNKFPSAWPSRSPPKQRPDSFDDSAANSYRGSGGSNTNSASTGGYYDAGSSSTRLSSSSTIPSSIDGQFLDDTPAMRQQKSAVNKQLPAPPDAPSGFSLRAAARTFSFGVNKSSKQANAPSLAHAETFSPSRLSEEPEEPTLRGRAMTESSYASTATPPKLNTELDLPDFGGFGDMFDGIGKRRSALVDGRSESVPPSTDQSFQDPMQSPAPALPPKSYSSSRLDQVGGTSVQSRQIAEVESSPYSWGSRTSHDGLMSSPSPVAHKTNPWEDEASPAPQHSNIRTLTSPTSTPNTGSAETFDSRPSRTGQTGATGLRRSSAVLARTGSIGTPVSAGPVVDEDARLVMDSVNASRILSQPAQSPSSGGVADRVRNFEKNTQWGSASPPKSPFNNSPQASPIAYANSRGPPQRQEYSTRGNSSAAALFDSDDPDVSETSEGRLTSNNTTPKAHKSEPVRNGMFAPPVAGADPSSTGTGPKPKVMTPAQFESYRREQESSRISYNDASSDSGEEDTYDDEDETERNRLLAKQRRKQEAHMAVYRQQMMKVTGEQPSELPVSGSRPGFSQRASSSAPTLPAGLSTIRLNDEGPSKSSDEEDEDVPLGILAAHGFPSKTRPPTSASMGPSHVRSSSQLSSYGPAPGSVSGETSAARSSVLPAFARQLPQDPYFGASLVNPSNRESLAYGHNNAGSVYGGPGNGLPPGGLVGVIAGEERARAARRGSPNGAGNFGFPQGPQQPGYGMPGGGRSMTMGQMPGNMSPQDMMAMMQMGGMAGMVPGDQTQAQISHMTQMMQTQMQWMQQMMQMQGMQGGPPMPQPPLPQQGSPNDFLSPPGQGPRPASMGTQGQPPNNLQSQGRTMSMMSPNASQWNLNNDPGYTPSIAPSERSNIGMPSRYRPVSNVPPNPPPHQSRASTFTTELAGNWQQQQGAPGSRDGSPSTTVPRKPLRPSVNAVNDDEDDDEGWEEMKKKREKKRSMWRLKKEPNPLHESFMAGK